MQNVLKSSVNFLKQGKIILYPTDTVWGIGCDATNFEAVSKVYALKKRSKSKSLIVLVNGLDMLKKYLVKIDYNVIKYIQSNVNPTTIVYKNPKNLAKNLIKKDNSIAIRVVLEGFTNELITNFGKPIVSTSANMSNKKTPLNFEEIDPYIKDNVDYISKHTSLELKNKTSKIILIKNGRITILRD